MKKGELKAVGKQIDWRVRCADCGDQIVESFHGDATYFTAAKFFVDTAGWIRLPRGWVCETCLDRTDTGNHICEKRHMQKRR